MYGLFLVIIVLVLPVNIEFSVSSVVVERWDNVLSYHPAPAPKKIFSVVLTALLGKPVISSTG